MDSVKKENICKEIINFIDEEIERLQGQIVTAQESKIKILDIINKTK